MILLFFGLHHLSILRTLVVHYMNKTKWRDNGLRVVLLQQSMLFDILGSFSAVY